MTLRLAEVAPVAAPTVEALAYLLAFAGLLFALGGIKVVIWVVDFIVWLIEETVGRIPLAGSALARLIERGGRKVTNALGHAADALDGYMGYCWHNAARLVALLANEIVQLAHVSWEIARFLAAHPTFGEMKTLIHALTHPIATFQHLERRLLREFHNRIHAIEQSVAHTIYPRLRAGEHAIDDVLAPDIAALRHRARAIEHRIDRLWHWVRAHEKIVVTSAFTAAVAVALARLGGRWIRCRNWRRIGHHVCGLPAGVVDELLGVLAGGVALADYRTLVRDMQKVERAAAQEVIDLLHAFD